MTVVGFWMEGKLADVNSLPPQPLSTSQEISSLRRINKKGQVFGCRVGCLLGCNILPLPLLLIQLPANDDDGVLGSWI